MIPCQIFPQKTSRIISLRFDEIFGGCCSASTATVPSKSREWTILLFRLCNNKQKQMINADFLGLGIPGVQGSLLMAIRGSLATKVVNVKDPMIKAHLPC